MHIIQGIKVVGGISRTVSSHKCVLVTGKEVLVSFCQLRSYAGHQKQANEGLALKSAEGIRDVAQIEKDKISLPPPLVQSKVPELIGSSSSPKLNSATIAYAQASGKSMDETNSHLGEPRYPPNIPALPPRPHKRVSKFFIFKFFNFLERKYNEQEMAKKFPGAMKIYRVFSVGLKEFTKEMVEYIGISKKVLLSGIRELSLEELDIYQRMPKEMTRVAPTLIISALPLMNYVMFPLAYCFPKRLLSSHFWSLQQKSQFSIDLHKKRLIYYRPVFRCLQANLLLVRDPKLKEKCGKVLDKIGSGTRPSGHEIMEVKSLFETDPYSLQAIYGPHVKGLCRMHGIHTLYLSRRRIYDRAEMLYITDIAMIKRGIFNLKTEELRSACFLRGLNASNTSQEDMIEYLQQWASISSTISPPSYSLLVHLPILLSYNNPNNWALLSQ